MKKIIGISAIAGAVGIAGYVIGKKRKENKTSGTIIEAHKEKRALQLASVASMIDQFTIPNIKILQDLGYKVDVVADFTHPGTITAERCENLKKRLDEMGVRYFDIAIPRSLNPRTIISSYKQVKELLDKENYNLLHCHSPIGGVIARQAAKGKRKSGLRVIYTAHGFHFYDGAPLKNWIVFYPIEKHYSRFTDVLITINKEDYERARRKFGAKRVEYVPGVGVDTKKFAPSPSGREKIREELGLSDTQILLLSVGELNKNKNHESVIRAIAGMDNLVYVVVGKGDREVQLVTLAKECNVDLRLPSYRNDVADFYDAADVYILPSLREGLNVSLMEAMASGCTCVCSRIRGNIDLVADKEMMFIPSSTKQIRTAINHAVKYREFVGKRNREKMESFSIDMVGNLMVTIYKNASV